MSDELQDLLRRAVEAAIREELAAAPSVEPPPRSRRPAERRTPHHLAGLVTPPRRSPEPARPQAAHSERPASVGLERPRNPAFFRRIVESTPTRIGTGRTGTRYRTETYLELRADHAIAKDAVYAEVPDGVARELGCVEVRSRCPDREHYLLHPNDGRRLDDESRETLRTQGTSGADVQVIVADGLAAPALLHNGPELLPALVAALRSRGLSVGTPILAHMARVGLQDDIGVLLGARATAICLGERPGLGTGDSMSIYIAVAPKLDQDNAEKNCLSNIRPKGLLPAVAAEQAAELIARGVALGKGGLTLATAPTP